ncbi:hypothetical protein M0802_003570 [Mischocyttarus mexicanus]|nr:hypothetical protein M0802_003570 [Mischocyttarus mexicanus]
MAGPDGQALPITLTLMITITVTIALHIAQFTAVAEPAWRQQRHVLHRTTHNRSEKGKKCGESSERNEFEKDKEQN